MRGGYNRNQAPTTNQPATSVSQLSDLKMPGFNNSQYSASISEIDGEFSPITVNKAFATRNYNNNRLGNPRRSNNAPTPQNNELNLNSTMSPSCGANMGSFKINLLRGDDDERTDLRVGGGKAGSTLAHQKAILGHPKILPRMNATPTMANFNKRQGYVQKQPIGQAKRGTLQGIDT